MKKLKLQHIKRIVEGRKRYYAELKRLGIKRPYNRSPNYDGRKIEFPNAIILIEEFNSIFREFGKINNELIIKHGELK